MTGTVESLNLKLWNSANTTDPKYTKKAKIHGAELTSISGTYMAMRATEAFGPMGIKWGVKIVEERLDSGFDVRNDKGEVIGTTSHHTLKILLWFYLNGERGEIEAYGTTPYITKTNYGLHADGEAPKKSLTDATKKALSQLGFGADIYMGMYDDPDYVQALEREQAIQKIEDKEQQNDERRNQALECLRTSIEAIKLAPTLSAAKKLYTRAVVKLEAHKEAAKGCVKRLDDAFNEFATEKGWINQEGQAA